MEILIDALLDWIADHSDYVTEDLPHPVVLQLTPEELTTEYYTGVAHLMPEDGVDERLNALYAATDGAYGTIYLRAAAGFDESEHFEDPTENPLWREVLLHELVHHVQWQSGEAQTWHCPAQGERVAYHLGGIYLAESHVWDPMGNRAFWAHMYSRC
ncbi:hypothetical protein [Marivita hallyeonensis]|uniref:Uncharacterized protein n=1 Tax=Marivita hallyeonensis TaxID=996342 RepID=A0A1M5VVX4_9RHOB|nr:hypothetical protein [Marivita hallyeonensis]SHH79405.1 hypothetical protein SAMN05443551_3110 [Marivita hallyeonensis]